MQILQDQTYSSPGETPLRFDFTRPDTQQTAAPLIICIHGGGWISGEKEGMSDVAEAFSAMGYATACPEYRLAPLHPYPSAIEDVRQFVRYAKQHAQELGIDPTRIATLGNSAGGHLAAMAGLSSNDEEKVSAVVAICPITDLTRPREQHFPIAWTFLEQFMGATYEGSESSHEMASPIYQITPSAPPFLIVHGTDDDIVPVAQSDTFVEALRASGVKVEFHRLQGESHSLSYESWVKVLQLSSDFLKEALTL